MAMAAVRPGTNAVAELPSRLRGGNCNDVANYFVSRNARVLHGVHHALDLFVAVKQTTVS